MSAPSALKIISKENYKRSTWKNGLGFTDEIAIYPPTAVLSQANFLWRLSSARIEKASPFSLFPNHDRMLIVLKGAGIKLIHQFEEGGDEDSVELPALEPYEFPGDIHSKCELIDGAITDFSIFLRRGEVEPLVQIENIPAQESYQWLAECKWNFAFCLNGSFNTPSGKLNEGSTLSSELQEPVTLTALEPHCRLLLISLA